MRGRAFAAAAIANTLIASIPCLRLSGQTSPSTVDVATAIRREFHGYVELDVTEEPSRWNRVIRPPYLLVDLNRDGVPDLVAIVRPRRGLATDDRTVADFIIGHPNNLRALETPPLYRVGILGKDADQRVAIIHGDRYDQFRSRSRSDKFVLLGSVPCFRGDCEVTMRTYSGRLDPVYLHGLEPPPDLKLGPFLLLLYPKYSGLQDLYDGWALYWDKGFYMSHLVDGLHRRRLEPR